MKFLFDAHLPPRLAVLLNSLGHNAIHVQTLPAANATPDQALIIVADAQSRVVVSKDRDFVESHLAHGRPAQLLHVATGNASRDELLTLFAAHLDEIVALFAAHNFVELTRVGVNPRA